MLVGVAAVVVISIGIPSIPVWAVALLNGASLTITILGLLGVIRFAPWGSRTEGFCSAREDEAHCEHWWDGGPCCDCDAPSDPDTCPSCGVEGWEENPECNETCSNCGASECSHPTLCNEDETDQ